MLKETQIIQIFETLPVYANAKVIYKLYRKMWF